MKRRSLLRRLRHRVEAGFVDALEAVCRHLSPASAFALGDWIGRIAGRIDVPRRRTALENLALAYGDGLSRADRERIVRGVYRQLGHFLLEYLLLLERPELRPLSRFIQLDDVDRHRAVVREHGAAIFVTLHLGHWELLGGAFSELVTPLHAVMKPLRNPLLDRRMAAKRASLGMVPLVSRRVVPSLFRLLRSDKSVALLCDFNQKKGPVFADFFGVPAATVPTPAWLAVRTGKPIVCGCAWSTGEPLSYRAMFSAPIFADPDAPPDDEVPRLVRAMNRELESFVRAHPDQWTWIHPRWKTRPAATEAPVASR